MNKKFKLILILVLTLMPFNVFALELNYPNYKSLGIEHSYVVGNFVFELDYGYTPNLKDFMKASRSIPTNEDVYLYEIQNIDAFDYFELFDVYGKKYYGKDNMPVKNVLYRCTRKLTSATNGGCASI